MIGHDELEVDRQLVARTRNTARYFVENPHVAWVALVLTLVAGLYGYVRMPKAKDPIVEPRTAIVTCAWPGASAERVEQLVTQPIEQQLATSHVVEKLESTSRTGQAVIVVTLRESIADPSREWSDLKARLDAVSALPEGTSPIQFHTDFGETATLTLAIASPRVTDVELELRAAAIRRAIIGLRAVEETRRATLVLAFSPASEPPVIERIAAESRHYFDDVPDITDPRVARGPGFLALDVKTELAAPALRTRLRELAARHPLLSESHPDVWPLVVVHDPDDLPEALAATNPDRYTHRDLDRFSERVQKHLQRLPTVARVGRTGIVPERIYLEYSQARLASYGIEPGRLAAILRARNITAPGGVIEVGGKNVVIDPSGELASAQEIGSVVVGTSTNGALVYLRDLLAVSREYEDPPRFLSFLTVRDAGGRLTTRRAITVAVTMQKGAQISAFQAEVDRELADVRRVLPDDLIVARTSDQPRQVEDNVSLFMRSLYETIALVVLVSLIGFWEWRTALLLALSIPITLAMTFAMMFAWGIDLQQVSIASLILALGLLVDDPVVASDAIKRSLGLGWRPQLAAWLGPTKLATAILFATVTNIAAYLPFLTVKGDIGVFLHSMPIVLTLSLVASRVVSMTFIPLLGGLLLRPSRRVFSAVPPRRVAVFRAVLGWAIDHRKPVFVVALLALGGGLAVGAGNRLAFFPRDLSNLAYVDVWLPEDAPLSRTREIVERSREVITRTAAAWGRARGKDRVIETISTYVGGGGPRFWASVVPEPPQLDYAQLVLELHDKHDTAALVTELQDALSASIAGARLDVRQLETGKPIGIPIAIRISGDDIPELRRLAGHVGDALRATTGATRVRDDWGNDTFSIRLAVDPDRANLSGVTNLDVAASSSAAMNGMLVGQLRDGDRTIDIVTRLRADERAGLGDVRDLYVMSLIGAQKVPLRQVSQITYSLQTEKIRRRNQFRTITVSAFVAPGVLPSEIIAAVRPALAKLELPPGYRLEIGGEQAAQDTSLDQMFSVALLMMVALFVALVIQFRSAVKPLIVFVMLPFGAAAALVSLVLTGVPLGFMSILGIISLMGVIVSHIIVLFDFIEEMRARGAPLRETLIDAGIVRLRPVVVTVVATVLGLIPLAIHGGPLWRPLCYAQIGGLSVATLITLFLVPIVYTIFILDLRIIRWER